ncbi:MAG: hypothetical protein ACRC1Z_12765 [Waterburya sp.]
MGKARILINYPIFRLGTTTLVILFLGCLQPLRCFALPPEEDLPEEILRTEIILEGRSPVDGTLLSAREYAELEAELRESRFDPQINEDIQQIIFLLQIRKLFKTIIPFI